MSRYSDGTAAAQGLACCHVCLRLSDASQYACGLCGASLHLRTPKSLQRTVALTVTAALLYIPANLLPIMTTNQLGSSIDSTIIGGVLLLIDYGSYPVAAVIFIASVIVPIGKLFTLGFLCFSVWRSSGVARGPRSRLYRRIQLIGKWSMTDVFVVAVLVALIHLGGLMRVTPGPAAFAFGVMVILSMLAAESFDPRLIWDEESDEDG